MRAALSFVAALFLSATMLSQQKEQGTGYNGLNPGLGNLSRLSRARSRSMAPRDDHRLADGRDPGSPDLPASDDDVVQWPVLGRDPVRSVRRHDRPDVEGVKLLDVSRQVLAVEDEVDEDLPAVQVDGTPANLPPEHRQVVRPALLDVDLLAQRLVSTDQRRRRKAHEAKRVRDASGLVFFDHRLVDRDVEPALHDPGIDDAESPGHRGSALHGNLELAADLAQVLLVRLERIVRDVARPRVAVRTVTGANKK